VNTGMVKRAGSFSEIGGQPVLWVIEARIRSYGAKLTENVALKT
jgi:hypothetical protein